MRKSESFAPGQSCDAGLARDAWEQTWTRQGKWALAGSEIYRRKYYIKCQWVNKCSHPFSTNSKSRKLSVTNCCSILPRVYLECQALSEPGVQDGLVEFDGVQCFAFEFNGIERFSRLSISFQRTTCDVITSWRNREIDEKRNFLLIFLTRWSFLHRSFLVESRVSGGGKKTDEKITNYSDI